MEVAEPLTRAEYRMPRCFWAETGASGWHKDAKSLFQAISARLRCGDRTRIHLQRWGPHFGNTESAVRNTRKQPSCRCQ